MDPITFAHHDIHPSRSRVADVNSIWRFTQGSRALIILAITGWNLIDEKEQKKKRSFLVNLARGDHANTKERGESFARNGVFINHMEHGRKFADLWSNHHLSWSIAWKDYPEDQVIFLLIRTCELSARRPMHCDLHLPRNQPNIVSNWRGLSINKWVLRSSRAARSTHESYQYVSYSLIIPYKKTQCSVIEFRKEWVLIALVN